MLSRPHCHGRAPIDEADGAPIISYPSPCTLFARRLKRGAPKGRTQDCVESEPQPLSNFDFPDAATPAHLIKLSISLFNN
jgi:hypothetical protein